MHGVEEAGGLREAEEAGEGMRKKAGEWRRIQQGPLHPSRVALHKGNTN